jgi:hypothetical protein
MSKRGRSCEEIEIDREANTRDEISQVGKKGGLPLALITFKHRCWHVGLRNSLVPLCVVLPKIVA